MNHDISLPSRVKRAFTLIEAVIAIAIISMSGFAMLAAASRCLAVASASRNYHAAVTVIDQGGLEHPIAPTNDVYDNVVEEVEYANGFTFSRSVEEIEDEEDLFLVRTKVTWTSRGKEAFEEVVTYLYSTNHF